MTTEITVEVDVGPIAITAEVDLGPIALTVAVEDGVIRPAWMLSGPNGAIPEQQSEWGEGAGFFQGVEYDTVSAYLAAASGTFVRATSATYWDASGVLQTAASGALRRGYNPATGAALGYRAEGQRTGIVLQSNVFSDSYWTKSGVTLSSAADAKVGTAWRALATAGAASSRRVLRNASIWGTTDDRLLQVFFKKDNWRYVYLAARSVFPAGNIVIDLDTNTVVSIGASPTVQVSHIRDIGGGWIAVDGYWVGGGTNRNWEIGLCNSDASSRTWDGTEAVYFAHAHGEIATFPDSVIPAVASSVTRNADDLSFAAAGTSQGSVVVTARTPLGAAGDQVLWQWDDGTESERLRLVRKSTRHLHWMVTEGGTDEVDLDLGSLADDTDFTVAAKWQAGSFAASLNGAAAVTNTSYAGALPAGLDIMREGRSSDGDEWFGTILRSARFVEAFSAAQLQTLAS